MKHIDMKLKWITWNSKPKFKKGIQRSSSKKVLLEGCLRKVVSFLELVNICYYYQIQLSNGSKFLTKYIYIYIITAVSNVIKLVLSWF